MEPYQKRAAIYSHLNNHQLALNDLNRALELEALNVKSLYLRGVTHFKIRNYGSALSDLDQAISLDSEDASLYGARGATLAKVKHYNAAISDFEKAIELEPANAEVYTNLGIVYFHLGNKSSGIGSLERALGLDPTNVEVNWLIEWYRLCEIPDMSALPGEIQHLERIANLDINHYLGYLCRALTYTWKGNAEKGLEEIEQAVHLAPDEPACYFWGAIINFYLERDESAIVLLNKSLELDLPEFFLTPLVWLKLQRPNFYNDHIITFFNSRSGTSADVES